MGLRAKRRAMLGSIGTFLNFSHNLLFHSQIPLTHSAQLQNPQLCIPDGPQLHFSKTWHLLGPFQIGTREAEWGADPLSIPIHGGFPSIPYDTTSRFHSSLARNGTVGWSDTTLILPPDENTAQNSFQGRLRIAFNDPDMHGVDWAFLRSIYGWAGVQFQAWARGSIFICPLNTKNNMTAPASIPITLHISPTLELTIAGKSYFGGDMYSYHRAPLVLYLTPGVAHEVNIRATHDIRAFGGGQPPVLDIGVEASLSSGEGLVVETEGDKAVVADVVGGMIAGEWGSVVVRNEEELGRGRKGDKGWVWITKVENADPTSKTVITLALECSGSPPLSLMPGQSRPLKFHISDFENSTTLSLKISYMKHRNPEISSPIHVTAAIKLNHKPNIYQPHIFTFLHSSGIVSYAAIRPPSEKAPCTPSPANQIPILLSLHGAGVDVRWGEAQAAYDALPDLCAWVLLPQGVTLWSGDDWHNWGFADVEAAVAAIPDWIKGMGWERQGVDLDKWVVTGHSNGGQGAWYTLTHRNDKIIAASPASGYLSIQAYVPYTMWHETDPRKTAILMASLNSYKHELLVENFAGTPIMQLHGELDDNVPTFHSRRMALLALESGYETEYYEAPGRGHWWEGVMAEASLPEFLTFHLNEKPELPPLPQKFVIIVANPGDMGPRGGIQIDQLESYDQLGRMDIKRTNDEWHCRTNNIRRFHLEKPRGGGSFFPRYFVVDGQRFGFSEIDEGIMLSQEGKWTSSSADWRRNERHGSLLGPLDSLLKSSGQFSIVLPEQGERRDYHEDIALQISRNLFQYYAADTEVVREAGRTNFTGDVVFLDFPHSNGKIPRSGKPFPIMRKGNEIWVIEASGRTRKYPFEAGLGVIFIRPLTSQGNAVRLSLVVWGVDEEGARAAARLLPIRTGVGQPSFVIVGREMKWKGTDGVKAMGLFDSQWNVHGAVCGS